MWLRLTVDDFLELFVGSIFKGHFFVMIVNDGILVFCNVCGDQRGCHYVNNVANGK